MIYFVIGGVCCILAIAAGTAIAIYDRPQISEETKLVTKGLTECKDESELSRALENVELCNNFSSNNEENK
ncbi:MAG: hypothetical protein IKN09_00865 [Clostridia bacterium]|nr:hypothetical protein [Clostridia bacterium]